MDRTRPSAHELVLLAIVLAVFVWSGISPHDRFTWVLEVFPVMLGVPALVYTYPRFRFTLAAVGIYGVMSYAVSQRAHELGIRMALGAAGRDVWRLVVGQGMLLTAIGLGIGMLVAIVASRVVRSLLYGVAPNDAATFGLVAAVLACVALAACYIPARRAARADPMNALRAG